MLTVLLRARGEIGGCCGQHHSACFLRDADEEIVDLLEVEVCHDDVSVEVLTDRVRRR